MYFMKFPFAVLLGIWSALFWRIPTAEDVVTFVEGTSLITVLRRDRASERAAMSAGGANRAQQRACEERHYYIRVDECLLEHVARERGSKYNEGVVTPIKSWSMKYTKTRCGGEDGKWAVKITSFLVNGEPVKDPESQVSFLHFYWTTAAHTKCHALGNALVERILSDEDLKTKLMESTWTTTWLHHGLLHGTLGPLTTTRTEGNKWTGLGSPTSRDSLLAESRNMSALGGADHGRAGRWSELELPLADFMMGARYVLRRAMRDNSIPLDMQEGIFLSCIIHAIDHVLGTRLLWGIKYKIDFNREITTWTDHRESAAWSFMWMAPTLHPFYHNKIWCTSRPFYKQLYRGLKEIDTLQIADEITASIMY
ncbi:unnamed protein product [Laminaria digitata]